MTNLMVLWIIVVYTGDSHSESYQTTIKKKKSTPAKSTWKYEQQLIRDQFVLHQV